MISRGLVTEGLRVVESVRRRHDGEKRNPWNEAECGSHYARAMAAWGPLLVLTGFSSPAGPRWMRRIRFKAAEGVKKGKTTNAIHAVGESGKPVCDGRVGSPVRRDGPCHSQRRAHQVERGDRKSSKPQEAGWPRD
jgi:hypothetical protein